MLKSFFLAADEFLRLRYSKPIYSEHVIARKSSDSSAELSTSGHGLSFVFVNGIGLGYSTAMANGNLEDISYRFQNSSLDLSYTIGTRLSFTLGAARIINGRGEIILDGVDYSTESIYGESVFLNLGIPFFGGEFLLEYHQDYSKFKNYQCQISGKSVILADPVNLFSEQIKAGIGLFF